MEASKNREIKVAIDDPHWSPRLELNRSHALLYQWDRYEECGTIDNFRILAGLKSGERKGFFYTDSDLHKWADAASRVLRAGPSPEIGARLEEYTSLMAACQEEGGYLFTYNQLLFPGTRWKNLQIEHELYTHGHFIEAGVSNYEATGNRRLLDLAEKAARLVVREFRDAPPERTSGHEEIELALIGLYRLTGTKDYLETARNLIERRGRIRCFGAKFAAQAISQFRRSRQISKRGGGFDFSENLMRREPAFLALRLVPAFLSGSYQQQDRPLRRQTEPKGHAVRWAYLATAAAMLHRESPDPSILSSLEASWEALVERKLYVTGGLGSLPIMEGFGRPYELDNRYSYSETCAAIGSVFLNRELSLATGRARYADLLEWQLENAASVGISLSGDRYFYRNPLSADGELERRPWYQTACCPSNISRLWAGLGSFICARGEGSLRIDSYVGSKVEWADGLALRMESFLPWEGRVRIEADSPGPLSLSFRVPSWSGEAKAKIDGGKTLCATGHAQVERFGLARFDNSSYLSLELEAGRTAIELELPMKVELLSAHPKVRADSGRVALCRGPLVYCAESVDNPGLDLEHAVLDPASPSYAWDQGLFGTGCGTITARTVEGRPIMLLPYALWGNRGASSMRVWLRCGGSKRNQSRGREELGRLA
jgi:DUF1680 family protein